MSKFTFPLESALRVRRSQADLEQAALDRLRAEMAQHEAHLAQCATEREQVKQELITTVTSPLALEAPHAGPWTDQYGQWAVLQAERLEMRRRDCAVRVAAQARRVQEARQKVELLERLRERQHGEWQALQGREMEAMLTELHLAQRARERSPRREEAPERFPGAG